MKAYELKKINKVLQKYKNRDSLIPILRALQDAFGYLPYEALLEVSKSKKVPLSRIFGIATFYSQLNLKPYGKNIIKICRGASCYIKGSKELSETIEKFLGIKEGETTPDFKFTLEIVDCLGNCALAPTMMVNNRCYGKLNPTKVKKILTANVKELQ